MLLSLLSLFQCDIRLLSNYPLYPNTTMSDLSEYEISKGKCSNTINCFLPYGICLNDTVCLCMPDYAHVETGYLSCSYKKKKLAIAGLLELFLPFGLGHYYAGHYILGAIKFIYNILVYSLCCVLYCKGHEHQNIYRQLMICIIFSIIIPIWNIVDLICFFSGTYYDGYGIPMN